MPSSTYYSLACAQKKLSLQFCCKLEGARTLYIQYSSQVANMDTGFGIESGAEARSRLALKSQARIWHCTRLNADEVIFC